MSSSPSRRYSPDYFDPSDPSILPTNPLLPTTYTIITSDNIEFEICSQTLQQCKTLYHLTENLDPMIFHKEPINLDSVKGRTMKKIVEWCRYHKSDGPQRALDSRATTRQVVIPKWDEDFLLSLNNSELFELICAANYLEVPLLMDFSCKTVANMAKGKSPEEMRQVFGIRSDEEDEEAALYAPGPSSG